MRGADAGQSWLLGVQASILHYARGLAEAAADGAPVLDAVITVSRSRLCIYKRSCDQQAVCARRLTCNLCRVDVAATAHLPRMAWVS